MLCLRYCNTICTAVRCSTINMLVHVQKKGPHKQKIAKYMVLLQHNTKKEKCSPASNRRRRCSSGSSERPDRCQRSPPRKRQKHISPCVKCTFIAHWRPFRFRLRVLLALSAAGHAGGPRVQYTKRKCGPWPGSVARALGVQSRGSSQVITGSHSDEPEPRRTMENPCECHVSYRPT